MKLFELLIEEGMKRVCDCGWGQTRRDRCREFLRWIYSPTWMLRYSLSEIIEKVIRLPNDETGVSQGPCKFETLRSGTSYHYGAKNERIYEDLKELKDGAGISIASTRGLESTGS
jgi:hypothetical protein